MPDYEVLMVARTPQASGPPLLTPVGRIAFGNLSYTSDLSAIGAVQTSVKPETLTSEQKARLRNLRASPTELWVLRDGKIVGAGTLSNYQISAGTLVLYAHTITYYMRYMIVQTDLRWNNSDQYTIARGLLNQWQNLPYGHFGLRMQGGGSGVFRQRLYPASELHNVYEMFHNLSEVEDGFDYWLNPETRTIQFYHPQKGTDRSSIVVFDRRNINSTQIQVTVQEGDVASDAYGTGVARSDSDGEDRVLRSHKWLTSVRSTFGRTAVTETFDDVSVQATLDAHTERLLRARREQLFLPAPGLVPVGGVDVGDFDVGDIIQYSFDAGLGVQTLNRRVVELRIQVSDSGNETMQVGLE